jgi:exodeoxyribonuclease-3
VRILSLNVNGIRSATAKGLASWLRAQKADVICLQEVRALPEQLPPELASLPLRHAHHHPAEKPGYSGVALYSRRRPDRVVQGLGWPDIDAEGRYLQADFGRLSVASVYVPSGSSSPHRQAVKFAFLDRFLDFLRRLRADGREYILCGDWNIAHRPIDLENWRSNQKNSGFLPEERAWLDHLFDSVGWVDAFRRANADPGQYTWWSNRGRAWEKNVGWRIDYQIVTPALAESIRAASIYKRKRFSDHAPLTIEYDLDLRSFGWQARAASRRTAPAPALQA